MRFLVVGYGNPLRQDDGVGPAVAQKILDHQWPHVDVQLRQQLHVDMIEDWAAYKKVLLIDAGRDGGEVELKKMSDAPSTAGSSHHADPAMLLELYKKVYGSPPEVWLLSIRGSQFDVGNQLSAAAKANADKALAMAENWLRKDFYA